MTSLLGAQRPAAEAWRVQGEASKASSSWVPSASAQAACRTAAPCRAGCVWPKQNCCTSRSRRIRSSEDEVSTSDRSRRRCSRTIGLATSLRTASAAAAENGEAKTESWARAACSSGASRAHELATTECRLWWRGSRWRAVCRAVGVSCRRWSRAVGASSPRCSAAISRARGTPSMASTRAPTSSGTGSPSRPTAATKSVVLSWVDSGPIRRDTVAVGRRDRLVTTTRSVGCTSRASSMRTTTASRAASASSKSNTVSGASWAVAARHASCVAPAEGLSAPTSAASSAPVRSCTPPRAMRIAPVAPRSARRSLSESTCWARWLLPMPPGPVSDST